LLERLNRADLDHLERLSERVVPESWVDDELVYSVLPVTYPSSAALPKLLVVHVPGQMFGAYELGTLVRWGPVSTGGRTSPTLAGLFTLNWRSKGHTSTVDPDWFLPWYFNFGNREGLAFHAYALPGKPASHGCVRLLEQDAQWLFEWGDTWSLDVTGTSVLKTGTPVFVIGEYDFESVPPWRSLDWLAQTEDLPSLALRGIAGGLMVTEDQTAVVEFLTSPANHGGATVDRIDTHTAIIFLAGARAYKLKRAVRFDYLDFSTADRRHALCDAEVRLNRRTAPALYRGVVAVTREPDGSLIEPRSSGWRPRPRCPSSDSGSRRPKRR
jgi:hypothetical protein